jgi:5'-3' exonuclease
MTVALIDGDIAAYRAAAATQTIIKWEDNDEPSVWANPTEAIKAAHTTIRLWGEAAGCSKLIVFLTGSRNFRKNVLPTYKSNRSSVARPVALKRVHAALKESFPFVLVDGLEADDLMGMTLTSPKSKGQAVIVSLDKDMRTIPGWHLNPSKDREPVQVTEAEANRFWFTQALTGDTSDGYVGCPGIGPKKAELILEGWDGEDLEEGFARLEGTFMARLGRDKKSAIDPTLLLCRAQADALAQLRMARILRHPDYDKRTETVTLWTPAHLPGLAGTVALSDVEHPQSSPSPAS